MQYARINTFSGLNATDDTTNAPQNSLAVAENIFVRPAGALRRAPAFSKLWNMKNLQSYVFDDLGFDSAEQVILLKIESPSGDPDRMTVLVAYDCTTTKTLGCFFVGRADGSIPTTEDLAGIQVPASTPGAGSDPILEKQYNVTVDSLIGGLTVGKRVYFSRIFSEIWIGNGVDPNMIYNCTTGELRQAGTTAAPPQPTATLGSSGTVSSVQARASTVITYGTSDSGFVYPMTLDLTCGTSAIGAAGNNVQFRIVPSGVNQSISSITTGTGTVSSPLVYTLTIGTTAGQSSYQSIIDFISSDPNRSGWFARNSPTIVYGANWLNAANPKLSIDIKFGGGRDYQVRHPLKDGMWAEFGLTWFAPDQNGFGYEGPISQMSSPILVTSGNNWLIPNGQKVILVNLPEAAPPSNRFTHYNVWMRLYNGTLKQVGAINSAGFGAEYEADRQGPWSWLKLGSVPYNSGVFAVTGDYEILELSDGAPNQKTIPPATMFEMAGDRLWVSGNANKPSRVWFSKLSTEFEKTPEGCDPKHYFDIDGKKEDPSQPKVTAIRKLEARLALHTDRSITFIETSSIASFPEVSKEPRKPPKPRTIVSRSDFGAINPACLAAWNRPNIVYLGSDGLFYSLSNTQYYRSDTLAKTGWPVMRKKVDIPKLVSAPEKCNMLADATNNIVMAWVPVTGMSYDFAAFAMDLESNALTGPIEWPRLLSCSPVSSGDSKYVGCDYDGDLFVFNLGALFNDQFSSNAAFTPQASGTQPGYGSRASGLPAYTLDDGTAQWISRGFKCVFETQYLNFQTPNERKGFYSLEWTVARYSRAIVKVILTSDDGHTKTFDCGQMYGRERNKIAFMISGNAIKVRFEAIVGEDKPFIVRDLTIGYELQTNAGGFFF